MNKPSLRVRISNIDHTIASSGLLDSTSLRRVPVIRVYGDTSLGQKACVHIHQVYPYFFVEYKGEMNPHDVNRYIAQLTRSLNHAMALSMKRNPNSPHAQFIRAIVLVKGVHFYGFHASYAPFLKILFTDPALTTRAVTLMQSGTIMHTRFQVFESHLSFTLQFMCDFGLYGCGWLDLGDIWERASNEEDVTTEGSHDNQQPRFKPSPYFRSTRMPLEIDVAAHQILNRHSLYARDIHHTLTIPQPPLPPEPLVPSVRELWDDERIRRTARGMSPTPEMPIDPSASSRSVGGEWIAEARWWDELRARIERERATNPPVLPPKEWERWIMSTFESVEALWDDEWKSWKPKAAKSQSTPNGQADAASEEGSNPFAEALGSAQSQSTKDEDDINTANVDMHMLASQALHTQIVENERHDKRYDNVTAQQVDDVPEDEDLPPPPPATPRGTPRQPLDEQTSLDEEIPSTPTKSKRSADNLFLNAWNKIGAPSTPHSDDPSQDLHTSLAKPRISYGSYMTPVKSPSKLRAFQTPADFFKSVEDVGMQKTSLEADFVRVPVRPTIGMRPSVKFVDEYDPDSPFISSNESSVPSGNGIKVNNNAVNDASASDSRIEEIAVRPWKKRKLIYPSMSDNIKKSFEEVPPSTIPWATQAARSSPGVFESGQQPSSVQISKQTYTYVLPAPSRAEIVESLEDYGLPMKIYRDPWYSNATDAPDRPREFAGLVYHLKGGNGLDVLSDWITDGGVETASGACAQPSPLLSLGVTGWEYANHPPSKLEVKKWVAKSGSTSHRRQQRSQIVGPTQHSAESVEKRTETVSQEAQALSVFSLELFAISHDDLLPKSENNEVQAVFYAFDGSRGQNDVETKYIEGAVVVKGPRLSAKKLRGHGLEEVGDELELLNRMVDIVNELDPDVVAGWEIQKSSWGYLNARAHMYGLDLQELLSRAPTKTTGNESSDQWGYQKTSTFKIVGRHVLNVWRIFRSELNLRIYTFENVAWHVLGRRIPLYTAATLSEWFRSAIPAHAAKLLDYLRNRASLVLDMLDQADFITKTAEFARVFGVDFFSVISRGSQFKVESFMFRIAKPESFVLLSPSRADVGKQNAAEAIPLIMEPLSAFYNSPLVVLDFQSLYPSVMIAYNLCYSTALGRVEPFKGSNKFGVTELDLPHGLLDKLEGHIHIAPNGIVYVKPEVRISLLARMLKELLETRIMIKTAMKSAKGDKALLRVLNARQLGLKLMANVVYGYCGASYSGRMPAVEVADSIVQIGRETLEKAIRIIEGTKKWGARVVYGDTDSLFIYLRGKTKDQAFRIGYDIADAITTLNPAPIKLKFEKVYLPCVLLAKKRYVGFKYESPDDKEPVFDAKGIETVRRDGCEAQSKMTEACLKILFRTQDLSAVKEYCCQYWLKILENKITIEDFIFAKEVRMGTYSDKGPPPPGVVVAARRAGQDSSDEAQYGERVPYVIIRGPPNSRLVDRAVAPEEVLRNNHKRLDAAYYIIHQLIPPLDRIFCLVGADVKAWYDEMPKAMRADQPGEAALLSPRRQRITNRIKIDEHFSSSQCILCGEHTEEVLCGACRSKPHVTFAAVLGRVHDYEDRLRRAHALCASCTSTALGEPVKCESLDCSWLYERRKAEANVENVSVLQGLIQATVNAEDPRF